jgi:hypothetical protein
MGELRAHPRLLLSLIAAAAYLAALVGPFQFDDLAVIVRYEPVHSLAAWWASVGHGIRPLLKLSYAVNWALGGAAGFHAFNLAVHLANTELVLRLCAAAADHRARWPFRTHDRAAFAAAVLFALHPVQTEAVTYISGRSSSLVTLFVLGALLAYAEGLRAARALPGLGLALVLFGCALFVKESSATLPLGFLIWDLTVERTRLRAALGRLALFAVPALALLVWAVLQPSYYALLYRTIGARPLGGAFVHQAEGVGYLLSRLVLVHRLSIDPGLGQHAPDPSLVAGTAAFLVAAVSFTLFTRRTRPLVTFGVLWFTLQVFLPYVFVSRVDVMNERHMYLANAGAFMAAGALWAEISGRSSKPERWRALGACVIIALALATARRNLDYRSTIALWESTVRASPSNPRAHNNLGTAYEASARYAEAQKEYLRALSLEPEYPSARQNLERVVERSTPPSSAF